MLNLWHRIQQQFFRYQKSDRNALIILGLLLVVIVIANQLLPLLIKSTAGDHSEIEALLEQWEEEKARSEKNETQLSLFVFDPSQISEQDLHALDLPVFIKRNILNYREAGGKFQRPEDVRKIYGMNDSIYEAIRNYIVIQRTKAIPENDEKEHIPKTRIKVFTGTVDPNSASFEKLVEFGFNTFQANNIVNYRNSGGVYKLPEDMLKIYGIDSSLFLKFRNHIKIVESLPGSETEKYVIPFVELNAADTAILKSLPGIGSAYASRIIKYRDLLGGFYSPQQLLEVYNFPEETFENISEYLSADTLKLEKLRINFFEFPELLRHPYLDKKQVEELINYRQSNGAFKNLDLIESLETFDRESFERVKPYLTCR